MWNIRSILKFLLPISFSASSIAVYPNPVVNNELTVRSSKALSKLQVIDLSGKVLIEQKVADFEATIPVDLPKGIYYLKSIDVAQNIALKKLIIQ